MEEKLNVRFSQIPTSQGSRCWGWTIYEGDALLAAGMRAHPTKEDAWENLKTVINVQELEIEGYE